MNSKNEHLIYKRNIYGELRDALIEVKESIEGKQKLNTLDNLINELHNCKR